MGQRPETACRLTGRAMITTSAALLLGLVAVAGGRALAPLMIERPDDRTMTDRFATNAVFRHAASYATSHDGPETAYTTAGRAQDD